MEAERDMGGSASRADNDASCCDDALVNRILDACRPAFADTNASPQEHSDAVSRLAEVRARVRRVGASAHAL